MAAGGRKAGNKKSKHSLIIWFMTAMAALLAGRLFMLTVIQETKWTSYAEDMSMRVVYETGPRGDILDRSGKVLAASRPIYSVNISRAEEDKEKVMSSASDVISYLEDRGEDISVTQQEVRETLEDTGYMSYMPITVAEDVAPETAEAVQEAGYAGVTISKNYIREYPEGALASHVIGYLGRISEEEEKEYVDDKGYRNDALIGKSGIERLYEEDLRGTDAVSRLQVDSMGKVTQLLEKSSIEKGRDITLTIDMDLQKTTEEALQKAIDQASRGGTFESIYGNRKMVYAKNCASGAAVAVDVNTGQVLAMASYPDFDPNDFVEGISSEKWASLQQENPNDPLSPSPLYNIAAMSAVQPGSTFKPVTSLAALSCGLDDGRFLYDAGYVKLGERSFGCHIWNSSKATHGYVDLDKAMKVSCNYYFYDIASGMDLASGTTLGYREKISSETISQYAQMLGLGEKTGIELEESAGHTPSEALKEQAAKASLKEYLIAEGETYFKKSILRDEEECMKNIEKIIQLADKDLTLNQLIGKLKQEDFIKKDKVRDLAQACKYSYFDQMDWSLGDTLNISIGQGDNAYTAVQMARYMATLGNGGVKHGLSLVAEAGSNDPAAGASDTEIGDSMSDAAINREHISLVLDAMEGVTSDPDGDLCGTFGAFPYSVAAKTGTAQRAGKINTEDEKEYIRRHLHLIAPDVTFAQVEDEADRLMEEYPYAYDSEVDALRRAVINLSSKDISAEDIDRYKESYDNFAWTVALAPADDPQIAVAVMLVQGGASSNAAPVVREMIGKYGEISKWEKLF